ncbi:MAG: NUDIX domain-containing protein [Clostridia bacterium]|nr:NUDIX domain-containing protein [Clostridia bacterium]
MRFIYCPQCGSRLIPRTLGDEGDVPWCEGCSRPFFDVFASCIITAVVNEQGEVALIRESRRPAMEVLVAGYVKPGESAEETVLREVEEELGLTAHSCHACWTCYHPRGDQLMHAFITRVKKADFALSDEIHSAAWVPLQEAVTRVPQGSIAQRLVQDACPSPATLVMLRGNSGSGKTTIARALRQHFDPKPMLISQDTVRREMLAVKDRPGNPTQELLTEMCRWSARRGGITILEGILDPDKYGELFAQLPGLFSRIHAYYLDIPFEETLRRHARRPQSAEFGEEAMRRWYRPKNLIGSIPEQIITEDVSAEDATARILGELSRA